MESQGRYGLRGIEMNVSKLTVKDGQTWFTIEGKNDYVVVHIKNAEVKQLEQKGTNINIVV
jgi:hypothetical protein